MPLANASMGKRFQVKTYTNRWLLCSVLVVFFVASESESFRLLSKFKLKDQSKMHQNPPQSGESAEVTFLTGLKNSSKLHQNDYHIVNINIPTKNASYTMHLSKPDDLLDLNHGHIEEVNCVYSGTVYSSQGVVGMASLSSCHLEYGFTGLLHLDNQHYQIHPEPINNEAKYHPISKPQVKTMHSNSGRLSKRSIKHKIMAAKTTANNRNDVKRIPPEELKKAQEQMLKDQELLEDEDADDDDDSKVPEQSVDNISAETGIAYGEIVQMFSQETWAALVENDVFAVGNKGKLKTRNRVTKVVNKKVTRRIIELAVFLDEAYYKKQVELQPTDTLKKINQYVLALVNNMNYLYQQPSMDAKIAFRLVHIGVQKQTAKGLKPTVNSEKYLDSFCKFAGTKNKNGVVWDHAMLITGLDMEDPTGDKGVIGLAPMSGMCPRYWSCSMVEYNLGFETAFTGAHEIGHSLGMEHDGEFLNKNCDRAKFLMAAIAGDGQINWSKCSNQNMKNFLKSGDPYPKESEPGNIPRCLAKRGSKRNRIRYRKGQLPGQQFDVDKQCKEACPRCRPYVRNRKPYNDVCFMLHCSGSPKGIIPVHPALEGTKCGEANEQKKCRNGKCQ